MTEGEYVLRLLPCKRVLQQSSVLLKKVWISLDFLGYERRVFCQNGRSSMSISILEKIECRIIAKVR